jgi:hypothetical protein
VNTIGTNLGISFRINLYKDAHMVKVKGMVNCIRHYCKALNIFWCTLNVYNQFSMVQYTECKPLCSFLSTNYEGTRFCISPSMEGNFLCMALCRHDHILSFCHIFIGSFHGLFFCIHDIFEDINDRKAK